MSRAESHVLAELASILTEISSRISVAMITSKDYSFVRPRTSFAAAWACVAGIEIALANGTRFLPSEVPDVKPSLAAVERMLPKGVLLERKSATDGRLLGFSVDWRVGPVLSATLIESIAEAAADGGLHVFHDPSQSFLDAYALKPDKGVALRRLSRLLGVDSGVMYLGDTKLDDPAFEASDIGICVEHGQNSRHLKCDYVVNSSDLGSMLTSLLKSDFEFTPSDRLISMS